jgi:putative two-component system response regulator
MVRIRRLRDDLDTSEQIIVSLVEALESSDPHARGHAQRVTARCLETSRRLELPEHRCEVVVLAALLHDIGKIGISSTILRAGAHRSHHEEALYRRHPELGERILAAFTSFAAIRRLIRHHHERLDGSGFPDGLAGADLDTETLILATSNRHDDLVCDLGETEATATLRDEACNGLFPPSVVEAVLACRVDDSGDDGLLSWTEILPAPLDPGPGTILLVGRDHATTRAIERLLVEAGHKVILARSGAEAEVTVRQQTPGLALVESQLPDGPALELASRLKLLRLDDLLPVVVLTTRDEVGPKTVAADVDDFLFLPVHGLELRARVRSLLRLHTYLEDLEDHHDVILALASALEAKDPSTHGHSERVGELAELLGRHYGLEGETCHCLRTAGRLHDIGKIGLPEQVLHKRGALEPGEFEMVMRHPILSERICAPLTTLQEVLPLIRHHHERFDGSGYPDGLAGEAIPLGARILGIADAFDALTSSRAYRSTYDPDQALALLERETTIGRWDPHLFDLLRQVVTTTDPTRSRVEQGNPATEIGRQSDDDRPAEEGQA